MWDCGASGDLDYAKRVVWSSFKIYLVVFGNKSPASSVVENAVALICCEFQNCFGGDETSPDFPSAWG